MSDTVASSLWLSLVDILVVFAVLAFLMLISYSLKFFSRGHVGDDSNESGEDPGDVDAASGDEPAHETAARQNTPAPTQDCATLPAVATVVDLGATGTDGAPSALPSEGSPVQSVNGAPVIITITWHEPDDRRSSSNPS